MPTLKKILEETAVSDDVLRETFTRLVAVENVATADLSLIFEIALRNKSLFPNIKTKKAKVYEGYLYEWVLQYIKAYNNPPSLRIAEPKKTCCDPALKTIIQIATEIDDIEVTRQEKHHNLFMSAENAQGSLLEEYIYNNIKEHGWICCRGNILRAIDFCTSDGSVLLQIKNKSNSENSSSSAIRTGTTIEKWYRLGTKTIRGARFPNYNWDELNFIVNKYSTNLNLCCVMSEDDYIDFLKNVVGNNKKIVSDL